jgi:anti-sigma B factor antagonist
MNPLSVETITDEKGRYAVVRTNGYINNLGAERIEQEIDGLIAKGFKNFIINFAQSPIINSMGLSILIGVIEKTNEIEGKLAFSNLTEVNAETMEIMGLTQYATLFPTEEEARAHFA